MLDHLETNGDPRTTAESRRLTEKHLAPIDRARPLGPIGSDQHGPDSGEEHRVLECLLTKAIRT